MKNKIGWCNLTFNPVWGCSNNCPYCYSRKMAKWLAKSTAITEAFYLLRNKLINQDKVEVVLNVRNKIEKKIKDFEPIFLESKFNKEFPQKTQKIFVGSMSEIYYWDEVWVQKVIDRIKRYPQHIFQFLTKYPEIYKGWVWPKNCWLGVTITKNPKDREPDRWNYYEYKQHNKGNLKFISFEPLLMEMQLIYYLNLEGIDWVIIGAETGNRRNKIIPKREWIEDIITLCKYKNIPVYLKDSLKNIYLAEIKEFPNADN